MAVAQGELGALPELGAAEGLEFRVVLTDAIESPSHFPTAFSLQCHGTTTGKWPLW